jgi:hypothetical protein
MGTVPLGDLDLEVRIILKWYYMRVWNGDM